MGRFALISVVLGAGCAITPPPPATRHVFSLASSSDRRAPSTTLHLTVDELDQTLATNEPPLPLWMRTTTDETEIDALRAGREIEDGAEEKRQFFHNMGATGMTPGWACPLVFVPPQTSVDVRPGDAAFDWNGPGTCEGTDWPTAATPWLVMDRDGDGRISSGAEMFGTGTRLPHGLASNGFEALAALDDDGDGAITQADAAWPALMLWSDTDGDRVSRAEELSPLAAHGVDTLELDYAPGFHCDEVGNCLGERASVGGIAGGALVDVYLRCR